MSGKRRKLAIEIVEWIDSAGPGANWGWCLRSDIVENMSPCLGISCGVVVKEDKEAITLVPHILNLELPDPQYRGWITIPKCAIRKRTKIANAYVESSRK